MEAAIEEAKKSKQLGDYAVGAVVVKNNRIISRAGNTIKIEKDPTNHAEVVAIREAARVLSSRHLEDTILYTTHEPCPMCAAAAVWAKMAGVIFGAKLDDMISYGSANPGSDWSWRTIKIRAAEVLEKGEPKLFLVEEFMREECKNLFHSS